MMRSMIEVCKLRSTHAGPLFCHSDTGPIIVGQFNADLPSCLSFSGLYTSRYKGHSFRIRAACHAADKGSLMLKFARLAAGNPMLLATLIGSD